MKKLLALIMSVLTVFTSVAITGCGDVGMVDQEPIDTSKTQLNVAISDDGIGRGWYNWLKTEYQKKNPDIQVVLQNRDAQLSKKEAAVMELDDDIACMGFNDYEMYGSYLMDVTDALTSKSYDNNYNYVGMGKGTVSAVDRLDTDEAGIFNLGTKEQPQYKVMPWYTSIYGIWYDVDMWEENDLDEYSGYYGLDGKNNTDDDLWGPDGEEGTYDDGKPATFEDFKRLLTYMSSSTSGLISKKPFTWSQKENWMQTYVLDYIVATYEQKNDYCLHYTFDGTHSIIGEVTPETGYKLYTEETRQGYKAALYFSELIDSKEYYSAGSVKSGSTHLEAQNEYLNSVVNESDGLRSMFLFDGSWWQYEAKDYFDKMADRVNKKYAFGTRKFAFFPFPKFIGTEGITDQSVTDKNICPVTNSNVFVPLQKAVQNGKADLVKDFILFAMSNEALTAFVEINNIPATLDFKWDKNNNTFNHMTISQLEYMEDKNTEILYMRGEADYSANECFREQQSSALGDWDWAATINGTKYEMSPLNEMCMKKGDPITAEMYWDGMFNFAVGADRVWDNDAKAFTGSGKFAKNKWAATFKLN